MMKTQMIPRLLAIGLTAAALAGCTVYQQPYETAGPAPYYAPPGYAYAPPAYGPAYAPAYVGPSFGLNFGFWDHDGGRWHDRDGRGWHGGHHWH